MMGLGEVVLLLALATASGGESDRTGLDLYGSPARDLARRIGDDALLARSPDEEDEAAEEKEKQQEDPTPQRPSQDLTATSEASGVVDFDWLEMQPRVGMALFSKIYHINASPCFGVEFRAPVTFLSPASNPTGDYFGVWGQLTGIIGKRTIMPAVAQPSGVILMMTLGVDYTLIRDETWLVLVRAGFQYCTYGGITDLKDGVAPVVGLTAGLAISRSLSITLAPEFVLGKSDYIILGMLGLGIQF